VQAADRLVAQAMCRGGRWLAVLTVTAVAGAVMELLLPFVLGRTVDSLIGAAPTSQTWLIGCAVVIAVVVVCESLGIWAAGASSAQASAWLRHRIVDHVLAVGPAMTRRFAEGDLVTRVGINTEEAGRAPQALVTGLVSLIPTVGSVIALLLIDFWLALTLIAGLMLIVVVLRVFLRQTTALSGGYQQAQGDIAARLTDALGGARTIGAAGTADQETQRVLAPLPRVRAHGIALWRANARAGVQAGVVGPLLEVAVLAVGGLQLAVGHLTVGELYAAARYAVLGAGLSSALGYVTSVARARSAARRVAQMLAELPMAYGAHPLPTGPSIVEFRGVAVDGLHDIDLAIPSGSVIAVVGRSGAGKSLLASLAGRLIDPMQGAVLLAGVPLHTLSREALRRAVGYAFERPVLVGKTLSDVIGLGCRAPDPQAVHAAARAACADAFIRRLPQGYETSLDAAPMSGGERQRIGLARAFAHGERLLILDDATSSLDTVTERQVTAALTEELRDRTRLIVAHRVATAANADRVIWLKQGRVRAFDTHQVLWENPDYRAAFQMDSS
jgi:ATP-binding cassette, subfamily B, bacterial